MLRESLVFRQTRKTRGRSPFVGSLLNILFLPLALLLPAGVATAGEVWLGVDTNQRTLFVMDGAEVLRRFENISVGRNGVTAQKMRNDQKTPLGTYHVRRINGASRFHLFFGLDYPTPEQAAKAYQSHLINATELEEIYIAHRRGEEPAFDTPLGGAIGIHGLGDGDPVIHEDFNWTDGCVALTNEQVDELATWVRTGTRVVIY